MLTEDEFTSGLGVLIRKLRLRKNATINELALNCGVDYSTAALIETGKQNPRAYTLYKILTELDVDLDSLLKEKRPEQRELEDVLIQKIRLFDDEKKKALISFLNHFEIAEK
ncbi:MAG: helix-turn-helix transcriptional regulator [Alphaproteobacteria bacterium]|nr:helix-turn-helix transcriptional regulator [Alphaproteobacteria bacterium]